jgi:ABC-2 type transport system permease protein
VPDRSLRHRCGAAAEVLRADAGHYRLLVLAAFRAGAEYRASLALLTLAEIGATVLDLAAVRIVFAHLPRLDGFTLPEVAFLYGTSSLAFALAEAVLGQVDRVGWRIRDGRADIFLIRPMGVLVQAAALEFSPQRVGRPVQPAVIVVVAALGLGIRWSTGRIVMIPVMILVGSVIAGSLTVLGSAVLFVAPDASIAVTALTQGSNLATQYPLTVYGRRFGTLLTVVLPIGFVNWQPALYVLSRPDPLGLPAAARFAAPVVAAVAATVAGLAWRAGVRHYRSTGS